MNTVNIMLVSDFHSGASAWPHTGGVAKDKSLSPRLTANLLDRSTRDLFLSSITSLLEGKRIDVLACCGDLGHQGSEAAIMKGVQYLSKLANTLEIAPKRVLVAPGNHDLRRIAVKGQELATFRRLCKKAGFTLPDTAKPGHAIINSVPIFCINSCLGGTEH